VIAYFKRKWNEWGDEKQRRLDEVDRAIWRAYHATRSFDDVSLMTGRQFEEFLARLFEFMGYSDIRMTPASDQGGDIVCLSPSGIATVIQAKRWNGPVGNGAVQEVLGAMRHYGCDEGIVVTNSRFTPAAIRLVAGGSDVTLHDKEWLEEKMREFLPASVPEFRRDQFEKIIEGWRQVTRVASETTTRRKRLPRGHNTFTEVLRYAAQAKGNELSVAEMKKLAQLHGNLSRSEAEVRELDRKMDETRARIRRLEEENAVIDEALFMSESSSWTDNDDDR
jgi:restriction endonuclease